MYTTPLIWQFQKHKPGQEKRTKKNYNQQQKKKEEETRKQETREKQQEEGKMNGKCILDS